MTPASILECTLNWSLESRLELVFGLWDQIVDAGETPKPSQELLAELDRRLAAYATDPSRVMTWDEVVASVKRSR